MRMSVNESKKSRMYNSQALLVSIADSISSVSLISKLRSLSFEPELSSKQPMGEIYNSVDTSTLIERMFLIESVVEISLIREGSESGDQK